MHPGDELAPVQDLAGDTPEPHVVACFLGKEDLVARVDAMRLSSDCGDDARPAAGLRALRDDQARAGLHVLVNRLDVWGGYVDEQDRGKPLKDGKKLDKVLTRPAVKLRGKVFLTESVLADHFRAERPSQVVGLHTTSPENTSRWAAVEVDWHGPDSTAPEVNLAAALAWYEELTALGLRVLRTSGVAEQARATRQQSSALGREVLA